MVEYVLFSFLGGVILLATSIFDYSRKKRESLPYGLSEKPSDPSEIPVGSSGEPTNGSLRIDPVLLGYLVAVVCQIPLSLSFIGVV
jgi:hypothetical protein